MISSLQVDPSNRPSAASRFRNTTFSIGGLMASVLQWLGLGSRLTHYVLCELLHKSLSGIRLFQMINGQMVTKGLKFQLSAPL